MSNLFRFNTLRSVQELSGDRQRLIGLQTHSDGNISAWATNIMALCEDNDHHEIYNESVTFLKSGDAISTYQQLAISSPILDQAVTYLRDKGQKIDVVDFNAF